jgi:hypothetical protein
MLQPKFCKVYLSYLLTTKKEGKAIELTNSILCFPAVVLNSTSELYEVALIGYAEQLKYRARYIHDEFYISVEDIPHCNSQFEFTTAEGAFNMFDKEQRERAYHILSAYYHNHQARLLGELKLD